METAEYRRVYRSRQNVFHLYPLGDIHGGIEHCRESQIKAKIKEIQEDPLALWIGMGDYAEFISPLDKRFDEKTLPSWVERSNIAESQRKWVVKLFEPIRDKCVGLLMGNHEDAIQLHNNQDVYLDICRDLKVKRLGYSCFLRFMFNRGGNITSFTGHFEHGSGCAQTDGAKMMRLKKGLMYFQADIYAMGHLHDIKMDNMSVLYMDEGGHIKSKERVAAITGSWFAGYEEGVSPSYVEKKGYSPTPIGCPVFTIIPDKKHIGVSRGVEQ